MKIRYRKSAKWLRIIIAGVLSTLVLLGYQNFNMDLKAQETTSAKTQTAQQNNTTASAADENTVSIEDVEAASEAGINSSGEKSVEGEKPDETESAIPEEENANDYLAEAGSFSVKNFDPTVWILILLFNLALAVAIERGIYIYKNRGNNAGLVDTLVQGISKNTEDPSELIVKVKNVKYGMEGRVAAKTLQGWIFGVRAMEEFSRAAIEAEQRLLDKRLVVLSTLGNNTPFIGLLGTVLGIMKAFRDLAMIGDAGPAVVMKGISEALIATAFGLAVAVPCVIAFNYFSKQVKAKLSNAEEIVKILTGMRSAFERKGKDGVQDFADDDENLFTAENKENNKPSAKEAKLADEMA